MKYLAALAVLLTVTTAILAQEPPPVPAPALAENTKSDLTALKTGEFWYGMYIPDGSTEGYARLKFSETKKKGIHCEWELHISGEGWTYEEDRQISFDADWKLTWSEMSSGMQRVAAAREGSVMVGKSGVDDLRAEVTEDAITGMGFILAGCMAQKKGAALKRTEYNEAQGMMNIGVTSFDCVGQEEVTLPEGKVKAWKYTMQRSEKGKAMPIWVNDAREIVQVDWGTDNLMKLHRSSTEELYKPAPPFLTQLEPDDKTKLVLTADFAGFTLDEMWDLWATGDGLTKWWPQEAEVEGKVGGKYQPTWRDEEGNIVWQLLGEIEVWEPKKKLGYTWKWNVDPPDAHALHVLVEFKTVEVGVNVKITHREFDPTNDDQINRDSLKGGWESFCTKLSKLKESKDGEEK